MRIGIYALAKNGIEWVDRWEASSRDADVRVVTDTGSTDGTDARLEAMGVTVARARILPWRWDVAHTQSLNALPADLDFCIRLDMDETLVEGWRAIVEAAVAATGDFAPTKLRHWYEWAPGVRFQLDRVHSRDGYRYTGATHEGLVRWQGEERTAFVHDTLIVQSPREREASRRESDLSLLMTAVSESPYDARMRWYLARELDYAGDAAAADAYRAFLALPGGLPSERAHASRQLSLLVPHEARHWLMRAFVEAPEEPDAACRLAWDCRSKGDPAGAFYWGCFAIQARPDAQSHASEHQAYGPAPWVWTVEAAAAIGRWVDAGRIARDGLRRFPDSPRLAELADAYKFSTDGPDR